jgi:N-methylhydantoinase A/oxoprolinase/acetone carboxylase beta subunit
MTPDLPDPEDWLGCGLRNALVMPTEGLNEETASHDEILRSLLEYGATNPETLAVHIGMSGVLLEKWLERLTYCQQIQMIGFTPTDALHVLGRLTIGNQEQAALGAAILAKALNIDAKTLCLRVIAATEQTIETIILDYLARKVWPATETAPFLTSKDNALFSLSVAVKIPIIGIGAASRCFLPAVAERLRTTVRFPEHYEVGNAMGAALISREGCAA